MNVKIKAHTQTQTCIRNGINGTLTRTHTRIYIGLRHVFGLSVRLPVHSSGQILLPRYLMNGLSNLDETYKE